MEAAALMDPPIDFGFKTAAGLPCSKQILVNGYKLGGNMTPGDSGFSVDVGEYLVDAESPPYWNPGAGSGSGSSSPDGDEAEHDSNATLKFINDILMEEDWDGKKCMFQDCMGALQAAEKSFSDALYGHDQPGHAASGFDPGLAAGSTVSEPFEHSGSFSVVGIESSVSSSGTYSQAEVSFSEIFEQEAWRLDGINTSTAEMANRRGMGGRQRDRDGDDDCGEEGRRSKYSATSPEESSPAVEDEEVDDRFLLCDKDGECNALERLIPQASEKKVNRRNPSKKGEKKQQVVDLREVLSQCAQAVASYDVRTATELLGKIRQQSSPYGDANQRLAHYFANSLEARLVGSSTHLFSLVRLRAPAADILKAYKLYVTSCPFKKISNVYANRLVDKLAVKATSLHIIDFGILYGFQWPCLIQRLSQRPGGPPRLRITGIDLPQPGFRPSERVEETGDRLAKYCKKFNVPFEYTPIAQKWESIKLEDLNLGDRHDMVVVNCLYRLRNLPDETVSVTNPRDTVLKLIRKINPDIFIQAAVNGTYDAPFFLTRFRETLFHFSALYDIFEATVPSENQERLLYEKEVLGRDAMNIIACEGSQRIDRPETYRRWQSRIRRAGFSQLPLDQDLMKLVRSKVRREYHKDFVVDEDKQWLLQGWKGRILYALTVWIPTSQD
uniref:Uncharacterized protein n=1 Tax=Kalanchoe fedtschenkoi TaxID=63787 RepID=A0A7N0UIT1_KALFE